MTQELKDKIDETFRHVADAINSSSLADLRSNVSDAIKGARNAAAEHIDEFQRLNSKVDPAADRLLSKVKESEYSAILIVFLFLCGMVAGALLHSLI